MAKSIYKPIDARDAIVHQSLSKELKGLLDQIAIRLSYLIQATRDVHGIGQEQRMRSIQDSAKLSIDFFVAISLASRPPVDHSAQDNERM